MLQGQRDFLTVGKLILSELAPLVSAQQGAFYMIDAPNGESELNLLATYAQHEGNGAKEPFQNGGRIGRTSGFGKAAHSFNRCARQLRER